MNVKDFRVEKINYQGWPNCYRLVNDVVDLVVTADVGPRIIRFGFVGGENQFLEYENEMGQTGGDHFRLYGGHRLWHAPEVWPRTYAPDNTAVAVEDHGSFVRFIQDVEKTTGIGKEIDIRLRPQAATAHLTHRLRNHNVWPVELAPWALTVMAPGGITIIPLPPRGSHEENFLPTSTLNLWAYTHMDDPRWTWGRQFIMLRQDSSQAHPQKVGALAPDGWIACARESALFVKQFPFIPSERYPDLGSCVETYTRAEMLEVETLGPLTLLAPGEAVEHVEQWSLFPDIPIPTGDTDITTHILPRIIETTFNK